MYRNMILVRIALSSDEGSGEPVQMDKLIRAFAAFIHKAGIHVRIQRGGGGGQVVQNPLKNHKNIGFLSKTGPDPLKNHEATKPAFNYGLSSARQRNAI